MSAFQEWAIEFDPAVWSKNDLNYCKLAWDRATALAETELKTTTAISTNDELPELGKLVLISDMHIPERYLNNKMALSWFAKNRWRFGFLYRTAIDGNKWMVSVSYDGVGHVSQLNEVTHWSPLPEY
jgi:uncharacterized membrane-anchored protein